MVEAISFGIQNSKDTADGIEGEAIIMFMKLDAQARDESRQHAT
jgi:hypothetical protein